MKPLPSNFVCLRLSLAVRLLQAGRARSLSLPDTLEEVAVRGLAALDEERRRADPERVAMFVHKVECAPYELEEWQQRVLSLSHDVPGIWITPTATVGDHEEALDAPYINPAALTRVWPTLVAEAHRQLRPRLD